MNKDDLHKKNEAMYHLEVCFEPMDEKGTRKPQEWIDTHITAAHYLVQSMLGGYKPDNYLEVLAAAAKLDAIDEANEAIHFAKNGRGSL